MKRIFSLSHAAMIAFTMLFALSLLSACNPDQDAEQEEPCPYIVTAEPAAGWRLGEPDESSSALLFIDKDKAVNFLGVYYIPGNSDVDAMINSRRESVERETAGVCRDTRDFMIDGYSGKEITYSYLQSGKYETCESATFVSVDGGILKIVCTSDGIDDFKLNEPALLEMLDSIKITKR